MFGWIARSSFFLSVVAVAGAMGLLYAGMRVPGEALAVNSVSVGDNFFSPQSIKVAVGSAVEWRNDGNLPHTVTADTGSFDSGLVTKTKTFSQTFEVAGTFTYACSVHPEMVGTVVVEAGAQPTPEPTPPPAASNPNPPPQAPVAAPAGQPAAGPAAAPAPGALPVGGGPPIAPGMAQGAIALMVTGVLFAGIGGGAMTLAARTKREQC
jgi:plastocyanin